MINLPTTKLVGYDRLKSFQLGGVMTPKEEQQSPAELIYVLHNLIKNTKKQPKSGSREDILEFIDENKSESETLSQEFEAKVATPEGAEELQNDDEFMAFYNQLMPNEEAQAQYAAKGAKLKKLKSMKEKGGSVDKFPGNSISGPTIVAKKTTPTTKEIVLSKRVPNTYKGMDVDSSTGKTHEEQYKYTKKVVNKAEGGKVVKPKLVKKGGKKKCTCGCEMIKSKAAGGKVIETCACKCGGKMKKKK